MFDLRQCSFIKLYRSFPYWWQVKCAHYSDRNQKNQAYDILIEKFKEIDAYAHKETVTRKINSANCIQKELAKVIASTKTGTGEDDIYKPNLWYFDKVEILNDPEKVGPSRSTIDDERLEDSLQEVRKMIPRFSSIQTA